MRLFFKAHKIKIDVGVYEVWYRATKVGVYFHKSTAEKEMRRYNRKLLKERNRAYKYRGTKRGHIRTHT